MWTRPLLTRLQHTPDEVRCECQACGAHTYAPPSTHHINRCGNCQSLSLVPLDNLAAAIQADDLRADRLRPLGA